MEEQQHRKNNSIESHIDMDLGLDIARALVQKAYITTNIAFSPNGRLLASRTSDGEIGIIDVLTGMVLSVLSSQSKVSCISFSPDGQTLVSGTFNGEVLIWDIQSYQRRSVLRGPTSTIIGVTFDPSGYLLASSERSGQIRLWDLQTGACLRVIVFSTEDDIKEVVLSPPKSLALPLKQLTPKYLEDSVNPYLLALAEVQKVIDLVLNLNSHEVSINFISQNSPIQVSLEGATQAINLVRDTVIPWRRKHAENMARLAEQEKLAEIEIKRVEVFERRIQADKERVEASKRREEVEKLRLENEKLRLELHREKIQLALDMLNMVSPNLAEQEKISYVVKLLSPLDILVNSSVEIAE